MIARWTVHWLKRIEPRKRLEWACRLFWLSIVGGVLSVIFLAHNNYERVLMAISWGAITITCVDFIATTDVRDEEPN